MDPPLGRGIAPSGTDHFFIPVDRSTAINSLHGGGLQGRPLGEIPLPNGSAIPGGLAMGGPIVTGGGLIFVAATTSEQKLRAFDVDSGRELWAGDLPASAQSTPMTFSVGGKQYIVVCAGGHGKAGSKMGDSVVAFALP